nr:MAG TPA: hypothetical protein [Caudoviricetes sp.]
MFPFLVSPYLPIFTTDINIIAYIPLFRKCNFRLYAYHSV